MNMRIRDLLTGKTLISAKRGRTLVKYHERNFKPGQCDWLWQYETPYGWADIPGRVLTDWARKAKEAKK
jgi:hypothetical protein